MNAQHARELAHDLRQRLRDGERVSKSDAIAHLTSIIIDLEPPVDNPVEQERRRRMAAADAATLPWQEKTPRSGRYPRPVKAEDRHGKGSDWGLT